ncbi:MAG: aminoacyl-tRNA hydrolase [Turneriella sp.]|nr:aminoacyl-tRNA hydrolase [Turneriella sp.]
MHNSVSKTLVVVGLMNPGARYRFTRHNAGAMALDALWPEARYHLEKKMSAEIAQTEEAGLSIYLLKPQTFMNNSGIAVRAALKQLKIKPECLVVFHDEVELPPGTVRHKFGGGHKGHNGLRSIIQEIGSADFHRIRIGVGRPQDPDAGLADYLLSEMPSEQRPQHGIIFPVWQALRESL